MFLFVTESSIILVPIGIVFVIVSEVSLGMILLIWVLLLFRPNFVSGLRLELMNILFVQSIELSLFDLHGFHMVLLIPLLTEVTSFVCTNTSH